jgi:hypothetical protein
MMEQPRERDRELDDERRGPDDRSMDGEPVESEPAAPTVATADRDMAREEEGTALAAGEREPMDSGPAAPTVATADRDMTREEEGTALGPEEREPVSAPDERDRPPAAVVPGGPRSDMDELFELFSISAVEGYRKRWDALQAGFVDDPPAAAQQAESLVSELMQRMTDRHATLRKGLGDGAGEVPDTESMRLTLRRYRAFFNSLVR